MIGQVIQLTPEEIERARVIAKAWLKEQKRKFLYDRAGVVNRSKYDRVLLGVMGEMAVAKHLNIPWTGLSATRKTDVGPYQVRTHSKEYSYLHLHPEAHEDDLYILVTAMPHIGRVINQMNIVGWITVRDAKQDRWYYIPSYSEREPCYRIPQNHLHPIETIPPWKQR